MWTREMLVQMIQYFAAQILYADEQHLGQLMMQPKPVF